MVRFLLVRTGFPLFRSLHHIPFLDGEDATLRSPSVLVCSQPLHLAFFPPSLLLSSCDLSASRLLDKRFLESGGTKKQEQHGRANGSYD